MPLPIDEVFEQSFLASLYDHFNPWTPSDDFYLELAGKIGGQVLDLGCGTGMLACRIAQEGLSVTAVDPAEGMLRVALARPGSDQVSWVKAAGQTLRLSLCFDLIYMTGHAFQALLTDQDATAVLKVVNQHLKKSGLVAFESRNPARRAWTKWTPDKTKLATTTNHGPIEEFFDCNADVQSGVVDIMHHYRFLDSSSVVTGRSRLRFIDQQHLTRLLAAARLKPTAWYGDWDRSPVTRASPEFIVVAACAD